MIGIVIVTHGGLAHEFRAALEHVVGPQTQIATVSITVADEMGERRRVIAAAAREVNDGDGCIILTDMFGGTPSNLAISVMEEARAEVIAGLNLPMLVKLAHIRELVRVDEALRQVQEAGRRYITVASHVLAT